jgi:hypothetical protein
LKREWWGLQLAEEEKRRGGQHVIRDNQIIIIIIIITIVKFLSVRPTVLPEVTLRKNRDYKSCFFESRMRENYELVYSYFEN